METSIEAIHSNTLLIIFAVIALTGIICSKISEILKIPDIVLYIIAGIIIGPSVLKFIDISNYQVENQIILTFGSAYILYLGGKEVSLKVLKNVKITVLLLSSIGVLVTALILSKAISLVFEISFLTALLAGTIIASTDPATLVPIFNQINIKKKVKQTIISESAFNDATGAILTSAVLTIILSGKFSFSENIYELGMMIIVGVVVGIVTGIVLLHLINDKPYGIFKEFAPIISILSVIIAYEVATNLGGSGYMSCFIVGVINRNKKNFRVWLSQKSYDADYYVAQTLGTICRMSIFIVLGSQVDLVMLGKYFMPSLLVVLILMFIARPICIILCTIFDRKAKWKKNEILFMMWVRETGVIPAALCGIVSNMNVPNHEIISSVVFMTILITIIIQGSTTKIVAKKLGVLEEIDKIV